MSTKYTDEQLKDAVAASISVMEVMRRLGIRMAGGSHSHLSKKIYKLNLDTSHFKGQGHNKGKSSSNRLDSSEILVYDRRNGCREYAYKLRRALIDSGVKQECACGVSTEWNKRFIQLEIDHINGDFLDNRIENLRFICPNCHSQEETTNKPHRFR